MLRGCTYPGNDIADIEENHCNETLGLAPDNMNAKAITLEELK